MLAFSKGTDIGIGFQVFFFTLAFFRLFIEIRFIRRENRLLPYGLGGLTAGQVLLFQLFTFAGILFFTILEQSSRIQIGPLTTDDEMPEHDVVETECLLQRGQRRPVALDIHERVVGFVKLMEGVSELAPPPILDAMDPAASVFDERLVALQHTGYLFALIRMNQEYDFVMTVFCHDLPMAIVAPPEREEQGVSVQGPGLGPCLPSIVIALGGAGQPSKGYLYFDGLLSQSTGIPSSASRAATG